MLYHYTTSRAAESIRRAGVILAHPVQVYRSLVAPMIGQEPTNLQPPVVWLTTNPYFDLSVVLREGANDYRPTIPGDFWRFGLANETAPLGLAEWAEKHGHALELFESMVLTGKWAGPDYTTWRLAERPLPASEWIAVETWNGKEWEDGQA